jgi:hypothetical protein
VEKENWLAVTIRHFFAHTGFEDVSHPFEVGIGNEMDLTPIKALAVKHGTAHLDLGPPGCLDRPDPMSGGHQRPDLLRQLGGSFTFDLVVDSEVFPALGTFLPGDGVPSEASLAGKANNLFFAVIELHVDLSESMFDVAKLVGEGNGGLHRGFPM